VAADARVSFRVVGASRSLHNGVMTRIDETRLPGIGLRHDFVTATGARIGVVTYRDGRRELVVYAQSDPDECCARPSRSPEPGVRKQRTTPS
jgi:hypothetical protein